MENNNKKRNRRRNNKGANKKAAEEPQQPTAITEVKPQESNEENKWEQVDLTTPVEVKEDENLGFVEQELAQNTNNTSGVNSYNPFDEVQEDDIIRAPQTNDGSFHHVPTSDEQLQANYQQYGIEQEPAADYQNQ